jgi:hypothetical protein
VYWKGIGVFGEDKGFHSVTHPSPSLQATLHFWEKAWAPSKRTSSLVQSSLIYLWPKGKQVEGSNDSVFGDSCQRGRKYEPKAKGPHHHLNLKLELEIFKIDKFQIGILLCSKGGESSISKFDISKPSWTLRGEFYLGGVLFSQRKIIWNRGRKFQISKMLCKILFIYLWLFAKELWKGFTKEFAKTIHVVQAWSKMLKMKKQSMHIL